MKVLAKLNQYFFNYWIHNWVRSAFVDYHHHLINAFYTGASGPGFDSRPGRVFKRCVLMSGSGLSVFVHVCVNVSWHARHWTSLGNLRYRMRYYYLYYNCL